jgi:hypothetical protein
LTDAEGNSVSFRVHARPGPSGVMECEFTDEHGKTGTYLIKQGRNFWNEYVRRGFNVVNKCIHHNMKDFHKAYTKAEAEKPWALKDYKPSDYTKDFYEKKNKELASKQIYDTIYEYQKRTTNYALEA